MATGHPDRAVLAFEAALSLWRGVPLADFVSEQFAQGEIARLEDLRMAAIEDLNDAKLALGRHAELVGQLEALIGEHPYRERLRAQLMLTLYRCERQADALQAYQDARTTLVEDLGIEPGERLRDLERAILAQDPDLALAMPETGEPGARRLPRPPTPTLGRDQDREEVRALLRRDDVRLVTLIGPGGVGKTRLALEGARRLEPELKDGAWFVSLAATANPEHVPSAIAQTLGATPLDGETPERTVERFLAPKDALVVLDNFEHVLPAALYHRTVRRCPGADRDGYQPRAPPAPGRVPLRGRSPRGPRGRRAGGRDARRGRRAVRRARRQPRPGLRADSRQRRRDRRDLPASRWAPAGHRARRGTHHGARPRGSGHTPRGRARPAGPRAARCSRSPAHSAGDHRVEPRSPQRRRGRGIRPLRRVRRRRHNRGRPNRHRCRYRRPARPD